LRLSDEALAHSLSELAQSLAVTAQAALEQEKNSWEGKKHWPPEIRSDNGSCYVSREFREVLAQHGPAHQRIRPHCPEENGLVERSKRTLREALEETEFANRQQAEEALEQIIRWYNHERLHRDLGYLRPVDYYRGQPHELHEVRRRKLAAARHRRRERNLNLKQPTLPLEDQRRSH
jgi:putative transposase